MLRLGRWARFPPVSVRPAVAGISGGETSGMMAALLPPSAVLSFQNTGKEHPRTYDFLERLGDALGREIVWLEYRPPRRRGDPPSAAGFERVTPSTASRDGAPFVALMEAINAYRAEIGKGPIAPWWRSRLCTTYMKTRLSRRFVESLGWSEYDELVGLRADEPGRVSRLRTGVPSRIGRHAPLSDAGVTKADVRAFWDSQTFQLGLPPHLGNCTGCFLKDQADLSRSLDEMGDAGYWSGMEQRYPGFGGKNFAGYARLSGEAGMRRRIEEAILAGVDPKPEEGVDPRRYRLVVIQERKRMKGQVAPFSCACEGSDAVAAMDSDEENAYIANIPEDN